MRQGDAVKATCIYSSKGRSEVTTLGAKLQDEMCFSFMIVSAVQQFTSCWHLEATASTRGADGVAGCFGMCRALNQSASFKHGIVDLNRGAKRFALPTEGACAA